MHKNLDFLPCAQIKYRLESKMISQNIMNWLIVLQKLSIIVFGPMTVFCDVNIEGLLYWNESPHFHMAGMEILREVGTQC